MRFLVDECTGKTVAVWLRDHEHEVFSVYEEARGMTDDEILDKASSEHYIIITNDKDFGEMIHREQRPHQGILLLRLKDERAASKLDAVKKLLDHHGDQLENAFVVVTESQIRIGNP